MTVKITRSICWTVDVISGGEARWYSKLTLVLQSTKFSNNGELHLFTKVTSVIFPSVTKFINCIFMQNFIGSFPTSHFSLRNDLQRLVMSPCITFQQIHSTNEDIFESSSLHACFELVRFFDFSQFEVDWCWSDVVYWLYYDILCIS